MFPALCLRCIQNNQGTILAGRTCLSPSQKTRASQTSTNYLQGAFLCITLAATVCSPPRECDIYKTAMGPFLLGGSVDLPHKPQLITCSVHSFAVTVQKLTCLAFPPRCSAPHLHPPRCVAETKRGNIMRQNMTAEHAWAGQGCEFERQRPRDGERK